MKKVFTIFSLLLIIGLTSCSENDALEPSSPTNSDIMADLSGTKWGLIEGCPDHTFLTINGYNECDYLNHLNFIEKMVFIEHASQSYDVPHHICYVYGNKLIVSIQDCANTTWKPMFEWEVKSLTGNFLEMEMTAPSISPTYSFQFRYQRLN